ncbi:ABC transporter substrate-binding protein [Rubeoparvulum massiliense]|uniref:ABC transporter substrate-binding protein n=1 Tax=Rubeoparvulum massiliense TaxID=1631346 RepID=UPI00065E1D81|nr:ABC transporter substrate-binding protein [Rubeoparvulum massiliense]
MLKSIFGRKGLFLLLTLIFAFSSLVACNSSSEGKGGTTQDTSAGAKGSTVNSATANQTSATSQAEAVEPVTIQYWHSHGDTQVEGLNYMLEEFKKAYPHITVEAVFQGGYGDLEKKLIASLAAGNLPTVTVLESASIPHFAESGILAEIEPFIQRDQVDLDDFSKGMLRAYSYNGKQVGLPLVVSASVFIYNKAMLDEAGVKPPETWAEVPAFAEALTIKEGNTTTRHAFAIPGWSAWYYDPWIINGGGQIIDENGQSGLNQEGTKKFLKNFQTWKENGWLLLPYGKGASGEMKQLFLDQKVAMVEHTSANIDWYIENAGFEIGVSFLPADMNRETHIGGAGIVIMNDIPDAEKEAAWQFVNFMTSAEHNIAFTDFTGYLPTRKSALASEAGQRFLTEKPQYKAILDWFDNVNPRIQHPAYGEFRKLYEEVVGKISLEGGDVDQLMEQAAKQMNEILEDY